MDTLVTITQFLLSLSLLIILHEMGHFFPARWFKTRVEKFYLFFDFAPFNSLFKIKRGDTEYGLGWLPLGGYVKIAGMVDESMDTEALKEPPKPWEFRSKPAWQRLIIMIGGVTVNFLLGFFIFAMMLWGYGQAYIPTSEVKNGLAMDSLLLRQGFRQGDLILKIGDQPFERIDPSVFVQAVVLNEVRDITILRDGQEQMLQLPADAPQQMTSQKIPKGALMAPRIPFFVEDALAGKPAARAGIQKGDRILALDGHPTEYYDEFTPLARARKNQAATLTVLRGADTLTIPLKLTKDGMIGVAPRVEGFYTIEREQYGFFEAFPAGIRMGLDFLDTQIKAFGQMFKGKISVQDNLGSLISIGKMFGGEWDWERFWSMTANLSLILAFMNLLPIPALDGGYVMFLLWEVVSGRKVSDKFMEKAVTIGFFLLLGLMVFALGNDIWRHWISQIFG